MRDPRITEAMAVEMKNLTDNETYEAVEDTGQEYIESIWDFKEKTDENGSFVKARLCMCQRFSRGHSLPLDRLPYLLES